MMDLMYGCGSDYDYSEEELPEVDLKAEHDRIIAITTGKAIDLMAELATSPLFDNEEFDELEIRFDASPRFDPYTIGSIGISSHKSPAKNINNNNNNHHHHNAHANNHSKFKTNSSAVHLKTNSSSNNSHINNTTNNHHTTNCTTINNITSTTSNSSIVLKSHTQQQLHNIQQLHRNQQQQQQQHQKISINGKSVNVHSVTQKNNTISNNNNHTASTIITNSSNSNNNSTNNSKQTTIVATIGSLSLGGLAALEDTCGALVEPASVVPVSVSSSQGSGSDVEYQEFPTDEEESECEFTNNPSNTVWVLPHGRTSRSPSPNNDPNDLPEFEFDEPEFIITNPGATIQEIPPPKKRKQKHEPQPHTDGKIYPKPAFSYSCLIAMSLKNSKTGSLPVSEIYKFMCDHFPYFKSAPSGWKNSVRHNLSLNKCFEKIEKPGNGARKGCLWALNPTKVHKMDEEVLKWSRKDPLAIRRAMSDPENLEMIEKGELKRDYSGNGASDEDEEEDSEMAVQPCTPVTQAQLLARRSRGSSDSLPGETTISTTTPTTTISLNRPIEQKIHIKSEPMDTIDFSNHHTITNIRSFPNTFECHTGAGTGTYTLSFSALNGLTGNSSSPIIIRRAQVK